MLRRLASPPAWPRWVAALLPSLCALGSQAQTTVTPADAPRTTHTAATLSYRSAFAGYKPYNAQPVQAWRESNDTVRRAGGWRAYARELGETAPPAPAAEAPASAPSQPKPAMDPHHHHGGRP